MTNYELIQGMEMPELAEFLRKVSDGETEFTICDRKCGDCANDVEMCEALIERWLKEDCENLISEKPIELEPWRKIITRQLTDEEKEEYKDLGWDYILENLPSYEEDVLVTDGDNVWVDYFEKDENGCVYLGGTDECVDGVVAWMPIRKYEL
ncbi:hypothetical protein [Mogibacterium diversum]